MRLLVAPKASREGIIGAVADVEGGRRLKVAVTAPADAGKANAAVIKLLAKTWRLPKGALRITAGESARRKTLFVDDADGARLASLRRWLERQGLERQDGGREGKR